MKLNMKWILFLGLAWASDPTIEVGGATLDDLDLLARQKAWSQLIIRMKEVPPADRTARWEALVEKAALGHIASLVVEAGSDIDATATTLLDEFPSLRRSRKYLDQRREVTLAAFRKCYDNPFLEDECGGRLLEFSKREIADIPLVRRVAAVMVERESPAAAWPLLKLVAKKINRDLLCRDDFWQTVVVGALSSSDVMVQRGGRELAAEKCWPQLKAKLVSELDRTPASLPEICDLLREKKSLTPAQAKKCPVPGKKPNR